MPMSEWITWGSAAFSTVCTALAIRWAVIAHRAARRAEERVAMMRRRIK